MNKENESDIPNKKRRTDDSDSEPTNNYNNDSDYWPDSDNESGRFLDSQIPFMNSGVAYLLLRFQISFRHLI